MPKKQVKKNWIMIKQADAFFKILYWFFSYPNNLIGLNDLSKKAGISKTSTNRIINLLSSKGFLTIEKIGGAWRIALNQTHPYNTNLKIPFNLGLIYDSGIINRILEKMPNAKSVILFGSYRKGDDTDKSDLDIAVEVNGNDELKIINFEKIQIGYRKNVEVKLHIFSRKNIDLNLFANIINGIVLHGFIEAKP